MNWEEKLDAISSFAGEVKLIMRRPGNWYVSAGMSVGGDGMLHGKYGNGATPQQAVEEHFAIYSNLPPERYAVAGYGENEHRARWNGYMWKPVQL